MSPQYIYPIEGFFSGGGGGGGGHYFRGEALIFREKVCLGEFCIKNGLVIYNENSLKQFVTLG